VNELNNENFVELLTQPISDDTPVGVELNANDPDFFYVLQEVKKDSNPTYEVNWKKIVGSCETLLKEKSKDLRLAIYLCRGKFQEGEYSELSDGLAICLKLMENLGDAIYPKDTEIRIKNLKWLSESVQRNVKPPTNPDEAVFVDNCIDFCNKINTFVEENFREPNVLSGLRSEIAGVKAKLDSTNKSTPSETTADKAVSPEEDSDTEVGGAEEQANDKSLVGTDYLDVIDKANSLFGAGKNQEALDLLGKGFVSTDHPRQKWILKFNLAKLCVKSNRLLLADTLLKTLKTQIETFKSWEPDLYSDFLIEEFELQPLVSSSEFNQTKNKYGAHYTSLCESNLIKALSRDREIFGQEQSKNS
jgi:hypothetical protein